MSATSLFRRLMVRAFDGRPAASIRKPSRPLGRLEQLEDRWVPTVGPNVNITHTAGVAEAETTISMNPVNPRQLYVDNTVTGQGRYSTDGGTTWQVSNKSGFSSTDGDEQTAWDQFGNLFLTQFGNGEDIEVGVSIDGGASFLKVFTVPGSDSSDQPSVAVGPSGTSAPGAVWVSYTDSNHNIVASGAPSHWTRPGRKFQ